MRVRSDFFAWFCEGRRTLFAASLIALAALPLHADIVTASASGGFEEAAYGNVDFTVNPDGSVTVNPDSIPLPTTYSFDFVGGFFGSAGQASQLILPALPPGSTINSATISFFVGTSVDTSIDGPIFNAGGNVGVQGTPTVTSVSLSPCAGVCTWAPPFAASYPITLSSTLFDGETLLDLNVAAADSGQITYTPPLFAPGEYLAGVNLTLFENYSITVDYSTTPEPRTTVLIALGMIALIAIRVRKRQRRVTA